MEVQEIEVFVEKDGKVRVEVHGVGGTQCLELTQALEMALGGDVESREMTSGAYEAVHETVTERQKEGR